MAPCGFVLHCCGLFVPYARILSNFRVGRHPRALSLTICYFVCFRLTSSHFCYLLKLFAYLLLLFVPNAPSPPLPLQRLNASNGTGRPEPS